jgi:hypothetical protein
MFDSVRAALNCCHCPYICSLFTLKVMDKQMRLDSESRLISDLGIRRC